MRALNLAIPDDADEALRQLADAAWRSPRNHASVLLIEAIERAVRMRQARAELEGSMGMATVATSAEQLAEEFDAEGERLLAEANGDEMNTFTRLALRMRGETWFRAAARLRAALPLIEAQAAEPVDRPTAA